MKSILIVATVLGVLALGVCAFLWSRQSGPVPLTQNSGVQTDVQSRPVSVMASRTKEGAQAVFKEAMRPYTTQPLQLGATVLADDYALQVWSSGDMAGEGLLQYDSGQNGWIFITANGGTWSEAGLISAGVPSVTAEILLENVPHSVR